MAFVTGSLPPLPPDPLRLRRRLALQGGGFALLLLAAFSTTLYGGISQQVAEDQRGELRQLAASAAAQLPLIAHETGEAEGRAKFRPGPRRVVAPALALQRVQWFAADGSLLSDQGSLPIPPWPGGAPPTAAASLWQRWSGGSSLWQAVDSRPSLPGRPDRERLGFVRVALSDRAARADLERPRRGLLLGAVVAALAALLVGRRMLRARSITLRLSPSPEEHSLPVRGHSGQLMRLFTNLLLNAIRHSPEGGTVALEVAMAGRQVRVAVVDQGPGIPPQARERVFDRFWSGSDQGGTSGLGLAIAQAIARRHGGRLSVADSAGGCVLLVELPIAGAIS